MHLRFTAFVMESGFVAGLAVNDWVLGGVGELDQIARTGITYPFGECEAMHAQCAPVLAANLAPVLGNDMLIVGLTYATGKLLGFRPVDEAHIRFDVILSEVLIGYERYKRDSRS